MKKIILCILLAICVSYGDSRQDLATISKYATQCANKDTVKYALLFANINQTNDINKEAIVLYIEYMENNCLNELKMIDMILETYNTNSRAALLLALISSQMINISNWFEKGANQYLDYAERVLR